jgi:hypothetical protein
MGEYAMLEGIKSLWQEARGTQLYKEYMDLTRRHIPGLSETQLERCGRAAMLLLNDWTSKFGPLKDCSVSNRKMAAREFHDMGKSYGFAMFSMHVEASYLTGDDAKAVYDLSTMAISSWAEFARKLDAGG